MRRNKRAQGFSMEVIVIAALVLIVLVVLIAIFSGQTGRFQGTIKSCSLLGGVCCNEIAIHFGGASCANSNQQCPYGFTTVADTSCKDALNAIACCVTNVEVKDAKQADNQ